MGVVKDRAEAVEPIGPGGPPTGKIAKLATQPGRGSRSRRSRPGVRRRPAEQGCCPKRRLGTMPESGHHLHDPVIQRLNPARLSLAGQQPIEVTERHDRIAKRLQMSKLSSYEVSCVYPPHPGHHRRPGGVAAPARRRTRRQPRMQRQEHRVAVSSLAMPVTTQTGAGDRAPATGADAALAASARRPDRRAQRFEPEAH